MEQKKIRIGIIGCGKIAQLRHIPEYAQNPNAELIGYYDFVYERAEEMAKTYGGRAFSTVEELLNSADIDAVSVCTANNAHASMTVAALEAGKHVLCEKPMATTLAECEAMVEASLKYGKKLMIAQNQRMMLEHIRAKELLESGTIGTPISFRTCFGHSGPDNWSVDWGTGNWFFNREKSGFGALADLGIHKIDLIQYLLNSNISKIQAMTATLDKHYPDGSPVDVEDNVSCLCLMESGILGTITASWTYYGEEDNDTVIYGTKGILKISCKTHSIEVLFENGDRMLYDLPSQEVSGIIDSFVDCLVRDTEPSIDGKQVLHAMRVFFAAVESAQDAKQMVPNEKIKA
jgi:predicted dehydrogenase